MPTLTSSSATLGAGAGLYNLTANYSNNVAPDVIVKATYDLPHFGHYEIGGLARWFRDRYYPNETLTVPSAAGAANNTKIGGGVFANARFPITHYVDFGVHFLGGTGVGRYGTSTLPDVTVHPDGTLAPIKAYQGLLSLELHPQKKLDLDFYYGDEYAQRTVYLSTLGSSAGKLIGYAPLSSSNAGCGIETLPTSTGNGLAGAAPYNPGDSRKLPRRNPHGNRNDGRIRLSLLQQPQIRPPAVHRAVQLPGAQWLGRLDQRYVRLSHGYLRSSEGDQQHGLHRLALLHPLTRVRAAEKAPFGVPFLLRIKLAQALLHRTAVLSISRRRSGSSRS